MSPNDSIPNGERLKLGQFVTNKWLVGVMLLLIMSMGGYIFRGIDKSGDAQAAQMVMLERRTTALEITSATNTAQYAEIIRRLDRMENLIYGAGAQQRRDRSTAP